MIPRYTKPESLRQMSWAQQSCNRAIKSGKLNKPDRCERCGDGGKIIGHHHNYSKPLDVLWLCCSCHGKEHCDVGFSGFSDGDVQVRLEPKTLRLLRELRRHQRKTLPEFCQFPSITAQVNMMLRARADQQLKDLEGIK